MASITKQSKETQERHRKILADLLKRPENQECADCRARSPTWASINLGIFLCIRCSGLHRQIGVHITKVRSCTMDLWDADQIAFVASMGNKRAKAIWEGKLPPDYGKPGESEDSVMVLQWIRAKYEKKKYYNAAAVEQVQAEQAASNVTNSMNGAARKKKVVAKDSGDASPSSSNVASPPAVASSFPEGSAFSFLNGTSAGQASNEAWGSPSSAAGWESSDVPTAAPSLVVASPVATFDPFAGTPSSGSIEGIAASMDILANKMASIRANLDTIGVEVEALIRK